jgi:hypothetical protein
MPWRFEEGLQSHGREENLEEDLSTGAVKCRAPREALLCSQR